MTKNRETHGRTVRGGRSVIVNQSTVTSTRATAKQSFRSPRHSRIETSKISPSIINIILTFQPLVIIHNRP